MLVKVVDKRGERLPPQVEMREQAVVTLTQLQKEVPAPPII